MGLGILLLIGVIAGDDQSPGGGDGGGTPPPVTTAKKDGAEPPTSKDPNAAGGSRRPAGRKPKRRKPGLRARVIDVADGDTITVRLPNGRDESIRYIGVDTPESVHPTEPVGCFGPKASDLNAKLVAGREVRLRFDRERRDYYGRLLAYVYRGNLFVNAELVKRGFARAVYYSPNGYFRSLFERLQRRAARKGLGLWRACRP